MPAGALDSLLQPRVVGTEFQHPRVIVTFDNDRVQGLHHIPQAVKRMAKIGENSDSPLTIVNHIRDAIRSIVGRGNAVDSQAPDLDGVPRQEIMDCIAQGPQFAPPSRHLECRFRDVDRQVKLAVKDAQIMDVVTMVVGNQESRAIADFVTVTAEPRFRLNATDPRIDQQLRATAGDKKQLPQLPDCNTITSMPVASLRTS